MAAEALLNVKDLKVQLLVILKDVSAIIRARRRQLQIKSEFINLINNVNIPVFGINKDGTINQWNEVLVELSGYKRQDVIRKKFTTFFIENKGKNSHNLVEDSKKGIEMSNVKFILVTKDDNEINLLLSTTIRRNMYSEIDGVICVCQDITEIEDYQAELEKKVEERTHKIIYSLKKDKELIDMKSQFVSMTSHEFRTPIAAISFTAELIKKHWNKITEHDRIEKLEKIESQANYINLLFTITDIHNDSPTFHNIIIDFWNFITHLI